MTDLLTAIGLVFVIEGIMISLFTEHSKKIMLQVLSAPNNQLKIVGIISALLGLSVITIARGF